MQSFFTWLTQIQSTNEDDLRRGRTTIVMALVMIGLAVLAIPISFLNDAALSGVIIIAIGITAYLGTIVVTRLGRVNLGGFMLITFIILPILASIAIKASPTSPFTSPFYLILVLLVAGLALRPALIWMVLAINVVGLFTAWSIAGIPLFADALETSLEAAAIFLQIGAALFIFVGGNITDSALQEARRLREEARQSAARLAELNASLETQVAQRTSALQTALRDLELRAAEQARLLAENEQQRQVIRELSVPVLPVRDTTLVMPLIGAIDTARLSNMQQHALEQIEQTGAHELLIDVTGVPVIDTQVAKGLIQLVEAARLMGTRVMLAGIRPEVAQTLVSLGVDLSNIRTFSTLQAALTKRS
ncbi:STAS domain-containing protein [uncultured Chloroflexus sp.]|uniref:STAS domain-containing protein n=1 Tax=uncultured Chloroflexus sp. TaxID=214040 RepID=UPI00262915FB|nr:STAS domain-containing protein [uncultured Chloroflexus sp.]